MRLFIAINFDTETKDNIIAVQNRLRELGNGNFSLEENLHLTLAFLGEVEYDRLDDVKAVMDALSVPEIKLTFSDIGFFRTGKTQDSQLWWIGIKDDPALSKLRAKLVKGLKGKGFHVDDRRFKPHITLAREMHLKRWDKKTLLPEQFMMTADHISLMLSEREGGRLVYTELYKK